MTLPEGVAPSGATEPEAPASEPTPEPTPDPTPEPTPEPEPAPVDPEDASDAQLRAWAKENGIEDVPASGKLSAAWREQITAAMAAAAEPEVEVPAEADSTDQENSGSTDEESPEPEPVPEPTPYRTPYVPDPGWVTGQMYTA